MCWVFFYCCFNVSFARLLTLLKFFDSFIFVHCFPFASRKYRPCDSHAVQVHSCLSQTNTFYFYVAPSYTWNVNKPDRPKIKIINAHKCCIAAKSFIIYIDIFRFVINDNETELQLKRKHKHKKKKQAKKDELWEWLWVVMLKSLTFSSFLLDCDDVFFFVLFSGTFDFDV